MSDNEKPKALRDPPARAGYEVGYARPPKSTRFKPGVSGNPKGRPKGAKNRRPALNEERLKDIILDEAYRTIRVRDGEKSVTVPVAQAVVRSLAVNAAKGQHRAQRLFSQLLAATETANKRLHDEWLDTAITYKVEWERELERRRRLGIDGPEPLPHPDHIEIDMATGAVLIRGPMTKKEKAEFDMWRERKIEFEDELAECRQELADNPEHPQRHLIEEEIAQDEKILGYIRRIIPD